jgi:hypothetical protein
MTDDAIDFPLRQEVSGDCQPCLVPDNQTAHVPWRHTEHENDDACDRRKTCPTRTRTSWTRHETQDRLYMHEIHTDYGGGPVKRAVTGPSREPDETSPPGKNVPGLLLLYGLERREPRPSHPPLQNRSRGHSQHAHRRHLPPLAALTPSTGKLAITLDAAPQPERTNDR